MLIAKLDKRLSKLSKKSGKRFKRFDRINGEPTVCNPPPSTRIPKWAVNSGCLESDGVSSDGIDDSHVVDPPIDLVEKTPIMQSEAVVESASESDTDSDFALDLS